MLKDAWYMLLNLLLWQVCCLLFCGAVWLIWFVFSTDPTLHWR